MEAVRRAAVAGRFYPSDPQALRGEIERQLRQATPVSEPLPRPRALVVPHAGYVYSGPVAASAFQRLVGERFRRVVVAGPSHYIGFDGIALAPHREFETPLGRIEVERSVYPELLRCTGVLEDSAPHEIEHSIEVELPWLQVVLGAFSLIPFSCGNAAPDRVAEPYEVALGPGEESLLIVSTDLSHYLDRDQARARDARTARAIQTCDPGGIGPGDACGAVPLRGLLELARRRSWRSWQLDLRNSSDTAGGPDRVVGYGAFLFA